MSFTCYCINLRIIACILRLTIDSLLAQVSVFAKIMEHGSMVDQFEEERLLNCLHQVLRIDLRFHFIVEAL